MKKLFFFSVFLIKHLVTVFKITENRMGNSCKMSSYLMCLSCNKPHLKKCHIIFRG